MIQAHAKSAKSAITTNGKHAQRSQTYLMGLERSQPSNVREGTQPFQERIESLCRQAAALTGEIEALRWLGLGVKAVSVEDGIDFYQQVRLFEISMIVQALKFTHGSQKEAAVLLRMNHTTLNSKIKSYHIDW